MTVEVKGLADIVRQAKTMIRTASEEAVKLQAAAEDLQATVAQVAVARRELDTANAELRAAVGEISNGGPPLEAGKASEPAEPVPPLLNQSDLEAALKAAANQVAQHNLSPAAALNL